MVWLDIVARMAADSIAVSEDDKKTLALTTIPHYYARIMPMEQATTPTSLHFIFPQAVVRSTRGIYFISCPHPININSSHVALKLESRNLYLLLDSSRPAHSVFPSA